MDDKLVRIAAYTVPTFVEEVGAVPPFLTDTSLTKLAKGFSCPMYGLTQNMALDRLLAANPQLPDPATIKPGDEIFIPGLWNLRPE
jgi:hypothetical protein